MVRAVDARVMADRFPQSSTMSPGLAWAACLCSTARRATSASSSLQLGALSSNNSLAVMTRILVRAVRRAARAGQEPRSRHTRSGSSCAHSILERESRHPVDDWGLDTLAERVYSHTCPGVLASRKPGWKRVASRPAQPSGCVPLASRVLLFRVKHRSRFGSGRSVAGLCRGVLAGLFARGRDRVGLDEGVGFRVSLRGISVSRVVVPRAEGDARCASLALSHLSLSLSLFV